MWFDWWFDWWFEELTEAARARIREEVGRRDGAWGPAWRLLHPNDPAHPTTSTKPITACRSREKAVEFLITFTITVPEGTSGQTVEDTKAREAERAHELVEQGHLLRLWTPPAERGEWRTLGLYQAQDATEMKAIVESLPLYVWMTVETTPLTQHPNDPAITTS